jgi:hypothetical protein
VADDLERDATRGTSRPLLDLPEWLRSGVIAAACLSPTILATVFVLAEVIRPGDPAWSLLFGLGVVQLALLYGALRPTKLPPLPPSAKGAAAQRLRDLGALFLEGERRRRRAIWYGAPVVFAIFALVIATR